MKRNILNSLLLMLLISATVACKSRKPVVTVNPPAAATALSNKKSENISLLKSKDVSFSMLAIKAKAKLDIAGNDNNVSMTIRIERDKQIWISITAIAGIEVARALITPDSIKVRNNLQGTYLKKPFSYVRRFSNNQVDFMLLQAILSGNTINSLLTEDTAIVQENGVWSVSGQKESMVFRILFSNLLKSSETNLNDAGSGKALKVVYGSFQQLNNGLFPSGMSISSMAGRQRIAIDLEYTKVDSNVPLEFPFNVPAKYELIN